MVGCVLSWLKHSVVKKPRPPASASSTAKNVEFLWLYPLSFVLK